LPNDVQFLFKTLAQTNENAKIAIPWYTSQGAVDQMWIQIAKMQQATPQVATQIGESMLRANERFRTLLVARVGNAQGVRMFLERALKVLSAVSVEADHPNMAAMWQLVNPSKLETPSTVQKLNIVTSQNPIALENVPMSTRDVYGKPFTTFGSGANVLTPHLMGNQQLKALTDFAKRQGAVREFVRKSSFLHAQTKQDQMRTLKQRLSALQIQTLNTELAPTQGVFDFIAAKTNDQSKVAALIENPTDTIASNLLQSVLTATTAQPLAQTAVSAAQVLSSIPAASETAQVLYAAANYVGV
jgi:hypothetical protein